MSRVETTEIETTGWLKTRGIKTETIHESVGRRDERAVVIRRNVHEVRSGQSKVGEVHTVKLQLDAVVGGRQGGVRSGVTARQKLHGMTKDQRLDL